MGTLFLLIAVNAALGVIGPWTEALSIPIKNLLADIVVSLGSAALVMVFWVWFGLQRPPWLPRLTAGLAPH